MPELPEVETTRRGIEPHIDQQAIAGATVRNGSLRWPVPSNLSLLLAGRRVLSVTRRGKYILLDCGSGHLILHLGMSGSLRLVSAETPASSHDHVDIEFANGTVLETVEDDSLTEGDFALEAGTYDDAGVEIAFDDLIIWDLVPIADHLK